MHGGSPAPDRTPVFGLLAANAISQIGNSMSAVALPWFVLESTSSPALVGLAGAAISVGGVLTAALGGPFVDRLGFKRASVFGDLACSALMAAIPLLALAGALAFPVLVLMIFLVSCINTQGDTARFALVPPLASRAAMAMESANSAERAISRMGQIVGPVAAGVLIVVLGAINVLFVNAATYLVSAILVATAVPATAAVRAAGEGQTRRSYVAELLEGLRFVRGNRLILSMVLIVTIGNFLDSPLVSVVLPVYAQTYFGTSTSLGLIVAGIGTGALVGTLLFGRFGRGLPRRVTFLSCFVLAPLIGYGVLAATPPLVLVVAAVAIAGVISGPINPLLLTVVQERTPPHLAGRVFGALSALAGLGVPLGMATAGFVLERVGLIPMLVGMGAIYFLVTSASFLVPALRGMDVRRQPA